MLDYQTKKAVDYVLENEDLNVNRFIIEYAVEKINDFLKNYQQQDTKINRFTLFKFFIEYILNRNRANYDSMVLITGQKGTGKSSAALMMAKFWCYLLDVPFRMDDSVVFSNAQVSNAIDNLPMFSPIICDEAIDFAAAQNWSKKENKTLKIKLGKVRTKHLFFILCFPWKINKLEKTYLDSYVNYWVDLYARGRGAVFVKDLNPVTDPWKLSYFKDLGSFNEFTSVEQIKKMYKNHPNFWDLINVPKPSANFYSRYGKIRQRNVFGNNDGVRKNISSTDIAEAFVVKAFEDIYMKSGTAKIKRLKKHFKERYDFFVKETDLKEVFKNSNILVQKAVEEEQMVKK